MGRLLLESYTKEGSRWLDTLTPAEFSSLCTSISDLISDKTLDHFVIILTPSFRKQELLNGTQPLYGLSYHFKHGIQDKGELMTKSGLYTEPKIMVLDDLVISSEGLASDDGKKIQRLFTHLLGRYVLPQQISLDLCYYKMSEYSFLPQLVLPIHRSDLVYVMGEDFSLPRP